VEIWGINRLGKIDGEATKVIIINIIVNTKIDGLPISKTIIPPNNNIITITITILLLAHLVWALV
jgi:hypothetical protein